jgi:hypothetical protein
MGENRSVYGALLEKPEGKRQLCKPRNRWVDSIKMDLQEVDVRARSELISLRIETGVGHL